MCVFAAFVDDWCLFLIFGYVVIGYVRIACAFSVFVDDWCLNVVLGYVVIGYVSLV